LDRQNLNDVSSVSSWRLDVPPLPCVVDPTGALGVFDAWSWCPSDVLEVRTPRGARTSDGRWYPPRIDGDNPPGLVFVMRSECAVLPRELARLHAFGYGLEHELALAPWAIDDATDLLYEHRLRPSDVFWLAASSLEAVVWGLHDWAHFHNHGPFEQPAMTELECDRMAWVWLLRNADLLDVDRGHLARIREDLIALSRRRFADERRAAPTDDLAALFAGDLLT
jgi:hypothetical protein